MKNTNNFHGFELIWMIFTFPSFFFKYRPKMPVGHPVLSARKVKISYLRHHWWNIGPGTCQYFLTVAKYAKLIQDSLNPRSERERKVTSAAKRGINYWERHSAPPSPTPPPRLPTLPTVTSQSLKYDQLFFSPSSFHSRHLLMKCIDFWYRDTYKKNSGSAGSRWCVGEISMRRTENSPSQGGTARL